ncbi:unnamed protein product [Ectocarpus sp. 6 AP-2014]
MLPPGRRRRRRRRRALTCVVALLLLSVPPGATESNVLEHAHSRRSSSRTAALIAGPGAGTRAWSSSSVSSWPWLLRGGQGVRSSRSSEQRLIIANARKDHDDDVAEAGTSTAAGSSTSGSIGIKAKPRWSGGTAVEGSGGGSGGGGERQDPRVHSLVDLVKLLEVSENPLWELVRFEGREASKQSHVSSMLHGSVLARTSLEDAVSCDVADKMATTFLSPTEVRSLMSDMYADEPLLDFVVAEDLLAHAMQDTSLPDVLTAMLFHKGFTALTTYRLMNWLWRRDRHNLARYLQSICSEVCAADIHPASTIGKGILMAGGCDIVIGETAMVGDGVCILQGVTLGGTGNQTGNRHPKVGKGCHIGVGSSILGNIPLGEGSRIEAASVVVKPIKPYTINRGVPSKTVAWIVCDPHQDVGVGVEEGAAEEEGEERTPTVKPRRLFSNYGSLYMGV